MNCKMKIVEECHVSCISGAKSTPKCPLPLTFFDIPWLLFPPIQPLFFYELDCIFDFCSTVLPRLKHSLSSTLEHFFPFAAKLTVSGEDLVFVSSNDSAVQLTVAQCEAEFNHLCSYLPKDAYYFYQFVPSLPSISSSTTTPLFAVKITYFSSSGGFCIGFAYHPVLCDQRTFNKFLQSWASVCKFGGLTDGPQPHIPSFDRSVVVDFDGLKLSLMKQWSELRPRAVLSNSLASRPNSGSKIFNNGHSMYVSMKPTQGVVRATFVMSQTDIEKGKRWIQAECNKQNIPHPVHLSPYVVTCALVWSCLVRAQHMTDTNNGNQGPMYFGFIAGGITRFSYRVPVNYFGNCVGFGRSMATKRELLGGNGILVAARVIGQTIKTLDNNLLGEASKWISDWEPLIGSDQHMNVVGSPKVKLYDTDFGWGRPKKIEEISIDVMRGISLIESRDMKGGMEIGITLPTFQMDTFSTLFTQGLHIFASGGPL